MKVSARNNTQLSGYLFFSLWATHVTILILLATATGCSERQDHREDGLSVNPIWRVLSKKVPSHRQTLGDPAKFFLNTPSLVLPLSAEEHTAYGNAMLSVLDRITDGHFGDDSFLENDGGMLRDRIPPEERRGTGGIFWWIPPSSVTVGHNGEVVMAFRTTNYDRYAKNEFAVILVGEKTCHIRWLTTPTGYLFAGECRLKHGQIKAVLLSPDGPAITKTYSLAWERRSG